MDRIFEYFWLILLEQQHTDHNSLPTVIGKHILFSLWKSPDNCMECDLARPIPMSEDHCLYGRYMWNRRLMYIGLILESEYFWQSSLDRPSSTYHRLHRLTSQTRALSQRDRSSPRHECAGLHLELWPLQLRVTTPLPTFMVLITR